jgi:hypothetical protein
MLFRQQHILVRIVGAVALLRFLRAFYRLSIHEFSSTFYYTRNDRRPLSTPSAIGTRKMPIPLAFSAGRQWDP